MSISGMTGFGRAEGAVEDVRWIWEARSVNGRSLDVKVRLPPGLDRLEPAAREAVQARFKRGSVQLSLALKREAARAAVQVDHAVVATLLAAGEPYLAEGRVAPPRWDGLLLARGVVIGADEGEAAGDAGRAAPDAALLAGLGGALDALAAARAGEGNALQTVLTRLLDEIAAHALAARAVAAAQPAALSERLRARLAALAPEIALDPQRLAQEAALIASRADVTEELDRLDAHVAEARALLSGDGPVGRRLEFLAQEFQREANTLGAKSSDLALTRRSLDLKAAIDQLKEQAANVE